MWATVIGFVLRYLPDLFSWIGGAWTAKKDEEREVRMIQLQYDMEIKRADLLGKQTIINNELTLALDTLRAEVEETRQIIEDRKSARDYGKQLISLMDQTLSRGKELGVWSWVLSLGWCGVLFIEMLASSVQPMIAVCGFSMWIYWKLAAPNLTWTVEDWWLMETIIGFYLAGRVKKAARDYSK